MGDGTETVKAEAKAPNLIANQMHTGMVITELWDI
jgi:hypothetical protein